MDKLGKIQTLAIALLLGVSFASSTVQAQNWAGQTRRQRRENRQERREDRREDRQDRREALRGRNWDSYGNYGGSFQLRQTALNAGYNEGIKEGRKARNRGVENFRNNSAYQKATKDYSSKLGSKTMYQRYYREGSENGYRDGWNGY